MCRVMRHSPGRTGPSDGAPSRVAWTHSSAHPATMRRRRPPQLVCSLQSHAMMPTDPNVQALHLGCSSHKAAAEPSGAVRRSAVYYGSAGQHVRPAGVQHAVAGLRRAPGHGARRLVAGHAGSARACPPQRPCQLGQRAVRLGSARPSRCASLHCLQPRAALR